jgi:hypothetical protein
MDGNKEVENGKRIIVRKIKRRKGNEESKLSFS